MSEAIATVVWQWQCPYCDDAEEEAVIHNQHSFSHVCGGCDKDYSVTLNET
tara:strand:+ start:209 stop:361 length:153 start_codon:yes stop_codon:yes gene_type:complete